MKQAYQIREQGDSEALTVFLANEGPLLLPMDRLIEHEDLAIGELTELMGRAAIETVFLTSARACLGPQSAATNLLFGSGESYVRCVPIISEISDLLKCCGTASRENGLFDHPVGGRIKSSSKAHFFENSGH